MDTMNHSVAPFGNSWLSLVAETAGVSGATITRVELASAEHRSGPTRAIVQIQNRDGQVMGATYWYGDGSDLNAGISVDLGCDLTTPLGSSVVAWIDEEKLTVSAQRAIAPPHAARLRFSRTTGMKLMLSGSHPTNSDEEFPEAA